MMTRTGRWTKLGVPTAVLAGALSLGLLPGSVGAVHEGNYPGHVHSGTCEDLGDVVFPLGNASVGGPTMGTMGGTPEASPMAMGMGEMMGSEDRVPVATTAMTVDASLEDILAEEHAINFHESEENIENYVACGDIGGAVMGDPADGGTLVIGLRSLNESGISGVATLTGMEDQTEVVVYLAEDLTGVEAADDEATPAYGSAEVGEEGVIDIRDFVFGPPTLEIPVGTTVTWTNGDSAGHTVVDDGGAFASDALNEGDAFSYTFEEAGSFPYHCGFHPFMKATVVVA